jgi:hypothetical protein
MREKAQTRGLGGPSTVAFVGWVNAPGLVFGAEEAFGPAQVQQALTMGDDLALTKRQPLVKMVPVFFL